MSFKDLIFKSHKTNYCIVLFSSNSKGLKRENQRRRTSSHGEIVFRERSLSFSLDLQEI